MQRFEIRIVVIERRLSKSYSRILFGWRHPKTLNTIEWNGEYDNASESSIIVFKLGEARPSMAEVLWLRSRQGSVSQSQRDASRESTSESHSWTSFASFAAANKLPFVAEPPLLSLLPRTHLHTMPSASTSFHQTCSRCVANQEPLNKEACAGILNCKYHWVVVRGGGYSIVRMQESQVCGPYLRTFLKNLA